MEILGVGPSELIFIVIIALIVLGPKDMQKAGKTIGKWLRDIVTSDGWKVWQQTSRELRTLPNRLMREANEEVNKLGDELNKVSPASAAKGKGEPIWMRNQNMPPRSQPMPIAIPENKIEPPVAESQPEESQTNESDQPKDA